MFANIIYTLEYNFNLISIGQLQETGILYHDHLECIILKKAGNLIGFTTRRNNIFVFDN